MTLLGKKIFARMSQSVKGRASDLLGKHVYASLGKRITYCQLGDDVQGKQRATLPIISLVITKVIWNEDSFTDYQLSDRHEKV